jgi:hypothetical protein
MQASCSKQMADVRRLPLTQQYYGWLRLVQSAHINTHYSCQKRMRIGWVSFRCRTGCVSSACPSRVMKRRVSGAFHARVRVSVSLFVSETDAYQVGFTPLQDRVRFICVSQSSHETARIRGVSCWCQRLRCIVRVRNAGDACVSRVYNVPLKNGCQN